MEKMKNISILFILLLLLVALYIGWGWKDDQRWNSIPLPGHLLDSRLAVPIPRKDMVAPNPFEPYRDIAPNQSRP